jgi:hypothetical protein
MVSIMRPPTSNNASTTVIEKPYEVLLEAALGRFQDTQITVRQHVVLDDRIVVSSASGEGYWHIPNDPALLRGDTVPKAVFEPDSDASFSYYRLP